MKSIFACVFIMGITAYAQDTVIKSNTEIVVTKNYKDKYFESGNNVIQKWGSVSTALWFNINDEIISAQLFIDEPDDKDGMNQNMIWLGPKKTEGENSALIGFNLHAKYIPRSTVIVCINKRHDGISEWWTYKIKLSEIEVK